MLVTCDCIQFRVLTGRSILQTLQVKYAMANARINVLNLQHFAQQGKKQRSCAAAAYKTPLPQAIKQVLDQTTPLQEMEESVHINQEPLNPVGRNFCNARQQQMREKHSDKRESNVFTKGHVVKPFYCHVKQAACGWI